MIKVQSFKISDADGINDLLSKYRLASGAHILVSDGQVCIPYEDGLEPTNEQKVIEILEQKNVMQVQYRILTHSQRVLEEQIKDIEGKIDELREQVALPKTQQGYDTKQGYDQRKGVDGEIKRLENVVEQAKQTHFNNKPEVWRMEINFQVFDEKVKELRG
jgi:beta-lactamase superfamily II metal-dependent hydrolase